MRKKLTAVIAVLTGLVVAVTALSAEDLACRLQVTVQSVYDGQALPRASVRVIQPTTYDALQCRAADESGTAIVDIPSDGSTYFVEVYFPGFAITTSTQLCERPEQRQLPLELSEATSFLDQSQLTRAPNEYDGHVVGVCGTLRLMASTSALVLHSARKNPSSDDDVIALVLSGEAEKRSRRFHERYVCVDGVFSATPGEEPVGIVHAASMWWRGESDLTQVCS